MSAIEDLERRPNAKFDERAFVEFLEGNDAQSGWQEGGRWELIEGVPIDMPPATFNHGIIAQNLERLLFNTAAVDHLTLDVHREVGLRHPTNASFRPVADVVLYDPAERLGRGHDRFYGTCRLIAEVLSPSTRHYDLVFKRRLYTEMPDCLHILFIEQEVMRVRHWARTSNWDETVYTDPEARVDLPEFGFSCGVRDLYARTEVS